MRRAVALLPVVGITLISACNAITGVSDLAVDAVEAGVTTDDPVDSSVVVPPRDARVDIDTGVDASFDANEAAAASDVTMTLTNAPNNVNLTTEGTTDWVEWGENGTINPPSHKNNGATEIIGLEVLPATVPIGTAQDDGHRPYVSWNDGTPIGNDSNNTEIGYAYGSDDITLLFKVKSTPTPRSFALYINAVRAKGTIEATFGAGRAMAAPEMLDAPPGTPSQKRVLFTFASADSAVLEIRFKMVSRYDTTNNISGGRLGFFCGSLF